VGFTGVSGAMVVKAQGHGFRSTAKVPSFHAWWLAPGSLREVFRAVTNVNLDDVFSPLLTVLLRLERHRRCLEAGPTSIDA
jgi:hypothetical protein